MPSYTLGKNNLVGAIALFLKDPIGKKYIDDYINGKTDSIIVNIDELAIFQKATADELIETALKYGMAALEDAVISEVVNTTVGSKTIDKSHISITGTFPLTLIHEIGAENNGRIIKVHGLVNKTAPINPMYVEAIFKCVLCGAESQSIIQENPWILIKPLPMCDKNLGGCGERTQWEPCPQLSKLEDSQEFTIQESYEDINSSKIPRPMRCITFKNYLLNFVNCGDDVEILCVVNVMTRAQKFGAGKSKFNVIYLEVIDINKRRKDPEFMTFTIEEELAFKELIKDPDFYIKMINSLAPSLYGHENEKEAVLLAIFGAPEEIREDITIRGNIHILMVGDPATAKSQLLRAAVELSPIGMYAVGRGASGVGLTAAMNKNPDTGEWEISAGVLVLADGGIAAIDEFEKMRDEDRANIHVPMEQQIVTIDKAGYHVQMKSRMALIAAANSIFGKYDREKSLRQNLGSKFPESLFSRFDLMFKILDEPNEEMDMKVVTHIIDYKQIKSPIDRNLLRKYIAYSKRIKPELSSEAANMLKIYFVETRKNPMNKETTFRQFEALKRLTLAHARALSKSVADKSDVEIVKRLFDVFVCKTLEGDAQCGEDGKNPSDRAKGDIMNALQMKSMSEDELINYIKCPEQIFRKEFTKLLNGGVIRTTGFDIYGKERYGITGQHYE
jgi:replicative DNA helicase Mcm